MAMVEPAGSFLGSFPLGSGHRSDLNRNVLRNMAGALSVKECSKILPLLIGQQSMLEIRKGMCLRKCLTRVIKKKPRNQPPFYLLARLGWSPCCVCATVKFVRMQGSLG
jgi:hypothetical protein